MHFDHAHLYCNFTRGKIEQCVYCKNKKEEKEKHGVVVVVGVALANCHESTRLRMNSPLSCWRYFVGSFDRSTQSRARTKEGGRVAGRSEKHLMNETVERS